MYVGILFWDGLYVVSEMIGKLLLGFCMLDGI